MQLTTYFHIYLLHFPTLPEAFCDFKLQCFGTSSLSNSAHLGVTELLSVPLFFLLGCQERALQRWGKIPV